MSDTQEDYENEQRRQLHGRHARDMEAIVRRYEERLEKDPTREHDEAVAHTDYSAPDVTFDPILKNRLLAERQALIEDAARTGKVINWHSAYPELVDKVRAKAGLPTSKERDHFDWLEEARASRRTRFPAAPGDDERSIDRLAVRKFNQS